MLKLCNILIFLIVYSIENVKIPTANNFSAIDPNDFKFGMEALLVSS